MSCDQTDAIIKITGKNRIYYPTYDHICKRINKLSIYIKEDKTDDDNDDLVLAVDSKGIKVTNRGRWMFNK